MFSKPSMMRRGAAWHRRQRIPGCSGLWTPQTVRGCGRTAGELQWGVEGAGIGLTLRPSAFAGLLMVCLVREFMSWAGLGFTVKVFDPEVALTEKLDRDELQERLVCL